MSVTTTPLVAGERPNCLADSASRFSSVTPSRASFDVPSSAFACSFGFGSSPSLTVMSLCLPLRRIFNFTSASGFIIEMFIRSSRLSETGFPGRAGGFDVSHQRAVKFILSHCFCNGWSNILHDDSEIRPRDLAVIHDLVHHLAREIHRNRESDSLIPARSVRNDCCVDANEFATIVHQRAAGIAWVDRGVCLDEILIILDAEVSAIHGADNSHGDGLSDAEGISDGQRVIAHLDF